MCKTCERPYPAFLRSVDWSLANRGNSFSSEPSPPQAPTANSSTEAPPPWRLWRRWGVGSSISTARMTISLYCNPGFNSAWWTPTEDWIHHGSPSPNDCARGHAFSRPRPRSSWTSAPTHNKSTCFAIKSGRFPTPDCDPVRRLNWRPSTVGPPTQHDYSNCLRLP